MTHKNELFLFEAKRGNRAHRYFMYVLCVSEVDYWWSYDDKKWMLYSDIKGRAASLAPCRTFRAFKRMIRKNPLLKGHSILISKYEGLDITST